MQKFTLVGAYADEMTAFVEHIEAASVDAACELFRHEWPDVTPLAVLEGHAACVAADGDSIFDGTADCDDACRANGCKHERSY